MSGPLQREGTQAAISSGIRLPIYPFVAAVMNSRRPLHSLSRDSKNRRFMAVIPMLMKDSCIESNLGGTTGAITRPFTGRVFFVAWIFRTAT